MWSASGVGKAQGTCEEEAAFGTGGFAPFVQAMQRKAFEMNCEWLDLKSNQSRRNVHRHRQVAQKCSSGFLWDAGSRSRQAREVASWFLIHIPSL